MLESDEYGDLKIFLATAIGAVANNSLSTTNQGFGNSITNSAQNVPLQGAQAVLDRYARRIEESQQGDGTFVRVSAGTEFYIFPLNVVEPQLASVAGLTQGGKPKNSWDLARDSYDAQQADDASRRAPTAEDAQRQMIQGALQQREAAHATGANLPQRQKGKQRRQPCQLQPIPTHRTPTLPTPILPMIPRRLLLLSLPVSLLLGACAHKPPQVVYVQAPAALPPTDSNKVRIADRVHAYSVGRLPTADGLAMNEAHQYYRIEDSAHWDQRLPDHPMQSSGPTGQVRSAHGAAGGRLHARSARRKRKTKSWRKV